MSKYEATHYIENGGNDRCDIESIDEAIEWAMDVIKNYPEPDAEDNFVGIYGFTEADGEAHFDRVAVVYADMVCVNRGHETDRWPAGWTEVGA